MAKIKRSDTWWGKRIDAAVKRGGFTDREREAVQLYSAAQPNVFFNLPHGSPCGCCVGELFEESLVGHDDRLAIAAYGRKGAGENYRAVTRDESVFLAVRDNKPALASKLYDELLRIRNEEYE